ncbi:bifunctional N-acetylglucosamine-1-phosphate uridyltransferase/glucosamine-1-phosphate acetyltransferase [Oleiphilus sp. HI0071]|nr:MULTISPECIES: bifunctional UDP-N-acetylglucosamine diphosphorylase/glucosamine-1-phosphate N-acetyltransferase GlmU [unclassified Oleiphilus]KZY68118.1 bifunctional N-acetylglucosamine-1-phosphate uridyltransferase/glucosamine-1-phosphate acetyltransferase [Oleiphilus sp. HI0065]KZY82309.1 bifunctional N-acetylglucosamine-1-phosphate uridyltransferase/glucosamine-1-phosphate acetyltransferase [Oleiphilus sp. HI0071]KZZ00362.1 bifunctional N-acetylglucosamine-1-phosphate uridyltransferase/gluc
MDFHIIVLAAGKGSRMKSDKPKVLHTLAGKPMLTHVLETALALNPDRIHVVIGHGADQLRAHYQQFEYPLNWVEQHEQLGTGHAVAQVLPHLNDGSKVLVLYGDVPLIANDSLNELIGLADQETLALLTMDVEDPTGYGRIVRNVADELVAIVEQKDANEEQLAIQEINTGFMAATSDNLKQWLPRLSSDNAQGEYYLTDLVALAVSDGKEVESCSPSSPEEVQGVNDRLQLCELECWFQSQYGERLLRDGVSLFDPNRIDIRGELVCGKDVTIDLNCVFIGRVTLADGVYIGPNCIITNSSIGENTTVNSHSVIEESQVDGHCNIGPFARLRPGTALAENAKIGNFVETKKANIGSGSKVNHLSYIGDAEIGDDVNIGAGTITCNYDGVNKYQTKLENDVFIGSNSSLVAPIVVKQGATVGAGSVVTKDVDAQQLAVARGKQVNISNWKKLTKK